MTDSSNNRSSIDSSLEGPHNSPAFLHDSTSASPRTEIPEQRPLPPLPTQDDGDETLNLGSEDEADHELSVYNTSFVPDDEGNRTSSPGVHSGEFHRHLPPQVETLRRIRSEAGLGTATHDPAIPEIGPEGTETSTDHHSSKYDSMSALTSARGRPLPKVPRGRPLPQIPTKRPLPAFPAAIKSLDPNIIAALNRRIKSLHQSLIDTTTRTRNLQALSHVQNSLLQAQAEMIDAQGQMLARYRALAE